jgi:hypothetical protein
MEQFSSKIMHTGTQGVLMGKVNWSRKRLDKTLMWTYQEEKLELKNVEQ